MNQDIQELTATESEKARRAMAKLEQRVKLGAEQQKQIVMRAIETVIVDRIWYPAKMNFLVSVHSGGQSEVTASYVEETGVGFKEFHIHRHAMGQMASVIGVPRAYVTQLREGGVIWQHQLLAHIFWEHFSNQRFETAKGKPIGFLRRAVGDQIRGFQGRSFGRNLATAPLLKTFVEECGRHGAGPIEAKASDVMTTLKCCMPYVFEPIAGEFVAFGVSFKNSDFGAAKLEIAGTIMRISSGTVAITEGALSRIHLGKVIDSDEDLVVSEETISKELDAARSAVGDMVRATLAPENVKNTLTNIALAHQRGIQWFSLSQQLSKVLNKSELEFAHNLLNASDDLIDLPPVRHEGAGDKTATVWWAANLIGWFANKEEDPERRQALHELAGNVLEQ